uniref:hypothetical protein n=1 Tax=Polaribacter sp. TaxID=1920175 RepID=UPI004047A761
MKLKTFKSVGFLFAAFFISSLYAQKFDKKFSESFNVNNDVILAVDATNADINISTWNRNQVSVEAVITVEGLSKKEAEKFLKGWKFEALGNKTKVQVNANATRFLQVGENNFNFNFPEIELPEINFGEIEIPNFEFPEIEIPEIQFDLDEAMFNIDSFEFDPETDSNKTFSYKSKGKDKTIVIKTKKEWEKFKKSPEYEEMKIDLKKSLKEAQAQIKNIDKKQIEEQLKKAKLQFESIDKARIKESLEAAKISIQKMNLKLANSYKNGQNVFIIKDDKTNKNVKITRKIIIKVPKKAKFDLNTRHSKVQLPKGSVSGKVSYGTFNSDEIDGGNLQIFYAPVDVKALNNSVLSLNNITDATIASVMNTQLSSNSSGLKISELLSNVKISNKFGELTILDINSNAESCVIDLNFSEGLIYTKNGSKDFQILRANEINSDRNKDNSFGLSGNFSLKSKGIIIAGKQSSIQIKKQ